MCPSKSTDYHKQTSKYVATVSTVQTHTQTRPVTVWGGGRSWRTTLVRQQKVRLVSQVKEGNCKLHGIWSVNFQEVIIVANRCHMLRPKVSRKVSK